MIEEQEINLEYSVLGKFKKNVFIYVGTNLLIKAATLITWFIIAKILIPSEIGKYSLALGLIEILSAVCIFGLDSGILRFYHLKDHKHQEVFSNATFLLVISCALFTLFFYFFGNNLALILSGFGDILRSRFDFILLVLTILATTFVNMSSAHYTALGKSSAYSKFQISQAVIFIVFSLLFLALKFEFTGLLFAKMISTLLPLIIFFSSELKQISFKYFSLGSIKEILKYSIPLLLSTLVGVMASYMGRFLLDHYTDLTVLGVYSFFLMIATNLHWLWHSFNQAWTPKIFFELTNLKRKDVLSKITSAVFYFSFFYLVFISILLFINKTALFDLLLKSEYRANIRILFILLIGPLFSGISVITFPLFFHPNRTKRIFFISAITSVVNIVITISLIRIYGLVGAALSFVFANMFGIMAYLVVFRKVVSIPTELTSWIVQLFFITGFGSILFVYFNSDHLFLIALLSAAVLSYRKINMVDLWGKLKNALL